MIEWAVALFGKRCDSFRLAKLEEKKIHAGDMLNRKEDLNILARDSLNKGT